MIEVRRTAEFVEWFRGLRDQKAKSRIADRIDRVKLGNAGDVEPVGDGLNELRVHYGPGYRVYFCRRGQALIIILCGGDKSTQTKDIRRAKQIAKEIK